MILAAGLGERLRPLTLERPKPLIPVANRPLIEYNLNLLKKAGIKEVAINLHYMGDLIKDELGDGSRFGLRITYSEEPAILGTGGGIKKLKGFFGNEAFLVINSDILIAIDLKEVVAFHRGKQAFSTMVLRDNPDAVRYGTIETDLSGRIREFLGKVKSRHNNLKKWMFTGIHVMDAKVLDTLPGKDAFCINRDVYAQWIRSEKPCYGFIHGGYWKDLGTIEDYHQANQEILESKDLQESFSIHLKQQHQIERDVSLMSPCLIGDRAVIKEKSVIGPGTIVGKDAVIGKGAQITQSILWPNAQIQEEETVFGTIVTRNLRVQVLNKPKTHTTPSDK